MERIGQYEILGVIGDGGMGTVYRGRDPRFNRLVAIKVLHAHYRRDPAVVDRFKNEAIIQAKLAHPNVVTVLDFVASDETMAMILEHVDGHPLDRVIEQCRGGLDPERALHLFKQILSAMSYAHAQGLVHRDLKPSNVLVQSIGSEEHAKVVDFGIAKILGEEKQRTATSAKMGTLGYMSPEQIRSPRDVDQRSDIYALGVILFEMATGRQPFASDSEYEMMRKIVEDPPPAFEELARQVPSRLAAVVERALRKDPAERFQSCAEIVEVLASEEAAPAFVTAPAGIDRSSAGMQQPRPEGSTLSTDEPVTAPTRGWPPERWALAAVVSMVGIGAAVMLAHDDRGSGGAQPLAQLPPQAVAPVELAAEPIRPPPQPAPRVVTEQPTERAAPSQAPSREAPAGASRLVGLSWASADNGYTVDWSEARDFCSNLKQGGVGGFRLPRVDELSAVVDPNAGGDVMVRRGINLSGCCAWSASREGDSAWVVNFALGGRREKLELGNAFEARALCIRE